MGNCLNCCKEPEQLASDSVAPNCNKEEMPEVRLYAAPSHVPASSAPLDTLLSNGNHLGTPTESASATAINRFYQPSRRATSRSAPTMGVSDSKPSDLKVNGLFEHYKDDQEDAILAEGIDQFCKDLTILPDDFKILILAWKLNAEQMCRFSRAEFVNGLKSIKCDSIKSIQSRLPELVQEVEESDELYKDLYSRFAFKFGLDIQIGQRILPTSMAIVLWKLVFTIREPPILNRWLNFLETHPLIRGIPKDTWNMFLNFSDHVGSDLSCYDDNEAWPSLFDDFVEFENDQANQNISKDLDKECDEFLIKDG
ncbi:hypothetical protein D910_04809 [Dendroctonus ponderosae]|uniref:Defective in cullin neddylation protein n=1 Tax=Dendroctonus ponderosae TaxID=77166 RepID=U4U0N5_DENPD|nr:hypothetical protein D910_00514 [Dendroctonus ponderosae]ERL83512.1 hypothetical protein D910_00543 [Dendroctonus ponderosae]ERL87414.1 hypothetical protein D910_04809 [Dendroctonus ponderosae]